MDDDNNATGTNTEKNGIVLESYVPLGPNHKHEEEFENKKEFGIRVKKTALRKPMWLKYVVKYTKCKEPECSCFGWKEYPLKQSEIAYHRAISVEYMSKETGVMDWNYDAFQNPVNELLSPCCICKHKFTSHTPHEVWAPQVIDDLFRAAIDMYILKETFKDVNDPTINETNQGIITMIRYALANSISPRNLIGKGCLPYSDVDIQLKNDVSIADAVIRHVNQRNVNAPQYARFLNFDLASVLLYFINNTTYETPQEKMADTGHWDFFYEKQYKRWLLFCHIPAVCGSLPYAYTARFMGLLFLCYEHTSLANRIIPSKEHCFGSQLLMFTHEFFQKIRDGDRYVLLGTLAGNTSVVETSPDMVSEIFTKSERPMGDAHISMVT